MKLNVMFLSIVICCGFFVSHAMGVAVGEVCGVRVLIPSIMGSDSPVPPLLTESTRHPPPAIIVTSKINVTIGTLRVETVPSKTRVAPSAVSIFPS